MTSSTTFKHATTPPRWRAAFVEEIDRKRFGADFDALFLPDTEPRFGISRPTSAAGIKAHLQDFDSRMNTHHTIHEFRSSPTVSIFHGEIRFSPVRGGEKVSQIVHVPHMDADQPAGIHRWYGSAGPGI